MNEFCNIAADESTTHVAGSLLRLTASEQKLLHCLVQQPNRLVSIADLHVALYGSANSTESNVLQVFIRRLRVKLQDAGAAAEIRTHHGRGYSLEPVKPA